MIEGKYEVIVKVERMTNKLKAGRARSSTALITLHRFT